MGQKTDQIYERGKLFMDKGNHEQALRLFNQVLNREPEYKKALKNKALILIDNKNKKKATSSLEFALEHLPEDDELQQIAGSFFINNNETEKGQKHFKKAIKINNSNVLAHYGLGIIRANRYSDHKEAVWHFSKAIEQNPDFEEAFFNRGCSHIMQDHRKEAHRDLIKARELGHPKAGKLLQTYFDDD